MIKDIYSIGEIAKLFKVSISKLRYYDEIDMIKPAYVNKDSGYRYYHIEQFETISMVLYFKSLGLSNENIKKMIQVRNPEIIRTHYKKQSQATIDKIKELTRIQHELEKRIRDIDTSKVINQMEIVHIDVRYIQVIDESIHNNKSMDYFLRQLDMNASKPTAFTGRYGFIVNKNTYIKRLFLEFHKKSNHSLTLEEGDYLLYRFKGSHADSSHHYQYLKDYIFKHELEVEDSIIEITLINDAYTNNKDDYVTEIQIKLKK